jgi:hypothetical protein
VELGHAFLDVDELCPAGLTGQSLLEIEQDAVTALRRKAELPAGSGGKFDGRRERSGRGRSDRVVVDARCPAPGRRRGAALAAEQEDHCEQDDADTQRTANLDQPLAPPGASLVGLLGRLALGASLLTTLLARQLLPGR